MLQTTVYLVNIITLGAVSCLFRVATSVKISSLKVLEKFFRQVSFQAVID